MPNGNTLYYFPNDNLQLVKLDFTVEAGTAYQHKKSLSHAANQLFAEASVGHPANELAEFFDFRGIVVERATDLFTGNVSFYFLRKYAEDLFPLLRELFDEPDVTPQLFDAYLRQRKQNILLGFQKTNYLARLKFFELLYGESHPMGVYARPEDLDTLTKEDVAAFIRQRYQLGNAHIVLAGHVDESLLQLADQYLAPAAVPCERGVMPQPAPKEGLSAHHWPLQGAVQSTIRIGRILPFSWDSMDYARCMVLNTVLGGYFGSRLMSNLREDKGYTYGVYSQTQVFRGSVVLFVVADVAGDATQDAVKEVFHEVSRLQEEMVSEEELERVRNVMMGDFIRSIDGVFERSERYRQMVATDVTEHLSDNLMEAIRTTTPAQIQTLAREALSDLVTVTAGIR